MSMNAGEIVAERFKHSDSVWFVYEPTGVGDWYRWRVARAKFIGNGLDDTYPCLAGCTRGKVYAGVSKNWNESDSNNGFTSSGSWMTFSYVGTSTYGDYRIFNRPADMTHVRVWFRNYSGRGVACISFLDSQDNEISHTICDTGVSTWPTPGGWLQIPAGAVSVKIGKDADDGKWIQLVGVDWLNKNELVDPNTAGSMMMDGVGGDTQTVISDDWGAAYGISKTTVEIAVSWNDHGSGYDGVSFGGISHRGIGNVTGTVGWQWQSDGNDLVSWNPGLGDKQVCDFLVVNMNGLTVYRRHDTTDARGKLDGKLIFDVSGVLIDYDVTVDAGADMDLYEAYLMQCRMPPDISRVYFNGDMQVRSINNHTVVCPFKTDAVSCWGGSNHTLYEVTTNRLDVDYEYFKRLVSAASYPRVFADTVSRKIYMMSYSNTASPMELHSGDKITTRFKINLSDTGLHRCLLGDGSARSSQAAVGKPVSGVY